MTVWICETCGVEHAAANGVCAICADERQWVPADGQHWTTLQRLAGAGHRVVVSELEPDLFGVTVEPKVGIGHTAYLVRTPAGSLLWDPNGFLDDDGLGSVRVLGEVTAIAASHPHMYGAQVEWSHALGRPPVLVCEPDLQWVARPDPVIETWTGEREIAPGLRLLQLGGHFPGSCVVLWEAGADGAGVLLCSDTIHINPDRATTTFLRSYPNRIPLSPAVVQRLVAAVEPLSFDRLYDNFGRSIDADGHAAVRRSADRYLAWVRGDHDELT